jgi:hypothetical protein
MSEMDRPILSVKNVSFFGRQVAGGLRLITMTGMLASQVRRAVLTQECGDSSAMAADLERREKEGGRGRKGGGREGEREREILL